MLIDLPTPVVGDRRGIVLDGRVAQPISHRPGELAYRAQRANLRVRNRTRNEITGVGQPVQRLVVDYGTHTEPVHLSRPMALRPEPSRRYPAGHAWHPYIHGNGGDGTVAYGQAYILLGEEGR